MIERVPLALAGAIVGWFLGWLSAWTTEWLDVAEGAAPATWRKLVRDPLVQGGSALAFVMAALVLPDSIRAAEAGLIAVPLVQVAVTDYRTRYVYTYYAAFGLGLGLAFGWAVHDAPWWTSVAGAIGGFVTFLVLYFFGRLVFRKEAMARGDITIAAMVGAGAATCTPQALVYGILVGGLIAAATIAFRRQLGIFMPYGPGLCIGGLATLFWC